MVVRFVDIGGIVDHHCLDILFSDIWAISGVKQSTQRNHRKSLTNFIAGSCIKYISLHVVMEPTTLCGNIALNTIGTGSYKSNYHIVATTVTPIISYITYM